MGHCKILVFHGCVVESSGYLVCDTVLGSCDMPEVCSALETAENTQHHVRRPESLCVIVTK